MREAKSRDREELARSHARNGEKAVDPKDAEAGAAEKQRARTAPPKSATQPPDPARDLRERWGLLPPKEAEDLINAIAGKLPERYRRWIEAYYRRASETRKR